MNLIPLQKKKRMPLPDLPFLLTILSPNSSRLKTMLHPTGPIILQVLSSV